MSAPVTVTQIDADDLVSATLRALAAHYDVDYAWARSDGVGALLIGASCDGDSATLYVAVPCEGSDECVVGMSVSIDGYYGISRAVDEALERLGALS